MFLSEQLKILRAVRHFIHCDNNMRLAPHIHTRIHRHTHTCVHSINRAITQPSSIISLTSSSFAPSELLSIAPEIPASFICHTHHPLVPRIPLMFLKCDDTMPGGRAFHLQGINKSLMNDARKHCVCVWHTHRNIQHADGKKKSITIPWHIVAASNVSATCHICQ